MPGGDSGSQTQTTTQQLSYEQRQIMRQLMNLANQVPEVQQYQGDLVAGLDPYQQQGQQAALSTVTGLQDSAAQQQQVLSNLLAGGPYSQALPEVTGLPATTNLEQTYGVTPSSLPEMQQISGISAVDQNLQQALTAPIIDQLNESVLPGISSAATASGAFGGARQALLEGQAREDAAGAVADTITRASLDAQNQLANQTLQSNYQNLAANQQGFGQQLSASQLGAALQGQQFGQALGLQGQLANQQLAQQQGLLSSYLGGLGAASGVAGASLLPADVLQQVGGQNQAQNQAEIDAAVQQWYAAQQAPIDQILTKAGILSGANLGGGSTTTTTSGSSGGASPFQSALGGAAIGAKVDGPFGALVGGGLGLLGGLF